MAIDLDSRPKNNAQKILQFIADAEVELEKLLAEYPAKIHDNGFGVITRTFKDGSIVVHDYSGHYAPHWRENDTSEWTDDIKAGEEKLLKIKGTRWVVPFGRLIRVFVDGLKAQQFYEDQLHLSMDVRSPVRYVDGKPAA
jgi:hypothetical protein